LALGVSEGTPAQAKAVLTDSLRSAFGRVAYSHKTHEKAREIEARRTVAVKWTNIVLVTATSGSLLSTVITNQRALLYVSAAFSAATLAFVIFQLSFDPEASSISHGQTAQALWYLRERYSNLLTDIELGLSIEDAVSRRDELTGEVQEVYSHASGTSSRAYKAAQKALKVNEEMYFSEQELDDLLPQSLRINPRSQE
jgi:hypothetical protein